MDGAKSRYLGCLLGLACGDAAILQKYSLLRVAKVSLVASIFIVAAAISSPLCFVVGKLLNRNKEQRTIRRFGREKVVYWGLMIPVFTLCSYAVLTFI